MKIFLNLIIISLIFLLGSCVGESDSKPLSVEHNLSNNTYLTNIKLDYPDVAIIGLPNNYLFSASTTTPTSSKLITISNDGNTTATNISLADKSATNYFSLQIASGVSNPCTIKSANELSINDTLTPGQMCQVNLVYTNPVNTFGSHATYIALSFAINGQQQWWPFSINLFYQTELMMANLILSTNSYMFSTIKSDGYDSNEASFTVTNNGDGIAQGINFKWENQNFPFMVDAPQTNCSEELNPQESCVIAIKFGPSNTVASYTNQLGINYSNKSDGDKKTTYLSVSGKVRELNLANIVLSNFSQINFSGGGTSSNPWVIEQGNTNALITLRFQNNSAYDANNFSLDLSKLTQNAAYSIVNNECNSLKMLNPNASCQIVVKPNTLQAGEEDLLFSNITSNYNDEQGSHQNVPVGNPGVDRAFVIVFSPLQFNTNLSNYFGWGAGSTASLVYSYNGGLPGKTYNIVPDLTNFGTYLKVNPRSCVLSSGNPQCVFTITIDQASITQYLINNPGQGVAVSSVINSGNSEVPNPSFIVDFPAITPGADGNGVYAVAYGDNSWNIFFDGNSYTLVNGGGHITYFTGYGQPSFYDAGYYGSYYFTAIANVSANNQVYMFPFIITTNAYNSSILLQIRCSAASSLYTCVQNPGDGNLDGFSSIKFYNSYSPEVCINLRLDGGGRSSGQQAADIHRSGC